MAFLRNTASFERAYITKANRLEGANNDSRLCNMSFHTAANSNRLKDLGVAAGNAAAASRGCRVRCCCIRRCLLLIGLDESMAAPYYSARKGFAGSGR